VSRTGASFAREWRSDSNPTTARIIELGDGAVARENPFFDANHQEINGLNS